MLLSRQCVACGRKFFRDELLRIVRTPNGDVVVDEAQSVMGRGAYMCKALSCIGIAQKGKRITKALKAPVPLPLWCKIEKIGGEWSNNEDTDI